MFMEKKLLVNIFLSARKNRAGFSLIEVLLVAVIVGSLCIASSVSILRNRVEAIDAGRLADIRQMQYALDSFANNDGEYPQDQEFIPGGSLVSRNGHLVYLQAIPHNPRRTGSCPNKDYQYRQTSNGRSYTITYCLGGAINGLAAGECIAMPGLPCVQNSLCSCDDINKPCCGYCNAGDRCGGGVFHGP